MKARMPVLLLFVLLIFVSGTGFQILPESARAQLNLSAASAANPLNEAPSTEGPSLAPAPAAFGKISPANGATVPAAGVVLKWEASSSNVRYEYCLRTNKTTCNKNQWKKVGTDTSTTLVSLLSNTIYYWQIRAIDLSNGSITYSNGNAFWSFKTALTAPGAFNKIGPADQTVDTARSLTLTWGASTGTSNYEYCIYGPTLNGNACTIWNTVSTNSAAISGLDYAASYSWQVRAVNAAGTTYANGSAGAVWSFKTKMAPPTDFTKLSPALASPDQPLNLELKWNPSAGTDVHYEYCVYGPALNGNACTTWTSVTTTSAAISGLDYMTTYSWQVRAVNPAGTTYADGSKDAVWSFTTEGAPPSPFFKSYPTSASTGQPLDLVLEWNPSDGATKYQYCIDTTDNDICDDDKWAPPSANTFAELTKLLPNTQYFWQVKASNSKGDVEADQVPLTTGTYKWFSFTTIAIAPAEFDKVGPIDGLTNRSINPYLYWWTPSDPENTYEYCVNTTASCPVDGWKQINENAYIHLVDTETLDYGTQYYWQVRATKLGVITEADGPDMWWSFTTVQAPPTSQNQSFTTPEDKAFSGQLALVNASNIRFFTLVGGMPMGTLTLQSDGKFTYKPVANYNGQVGFRFIVSDGLNPPNGPYTATLDVTPVNDAPMLKAIPDVVVKAGNTATFTASATDVDTIYGQKLTYSLAGILPAGVTINSTTGVFTWATSSTLTPRIYTLTVKVTDNGASPQSATRAVRIIVNPGVPVTGEKLLIYLPMIIHP